MITTEDDTTLVPLHATHVIDHVSYHVVYVVIIPVHVGAAAVPPAQVQPISSYTSFSVVGSRSSHGSFGVGLFHALNVPSGHTGSTIL